MKHFIRLLIYQKMPAHSFGVKSIFLLCSIAIYHTRAKKYWHNLFFCI